jgi:DNA repair exonuclease SbcCD ATPase subunit
MKDLRRIVEAYKVNNDIKDALLEDLENFVHESVTAASSGTISKTQYDKLLKQRSELNTQAAEHEHEIAELKEQLEKTKSSLSDMETIKKEYEQFKQKQIEQLKSKWETAKLKIDVQEDNPQYEKINKIKGRFKLDAESEQDIKRNLEAFELLEETGFFGKPEKDIQDGHPRKPTKKKEYRPFSGFST